MDLNPLHETGIPVDKQGVAVKELVRPSFSAEPDAAWSRLHLLLAQAMWEQSRRFLLEFSNMVPMHRLAAQRLLRTTNQHAVLTQWLQPCDESALHAAIRYAQAGLVTQAEQAVVSDPPQLAPTFAVLGGRDLDRLRSIVGHVAHLEGEEAIGHVLDWEAPAAPADPALVRSETPMLDDAWQDVGPLGRLQAVQSAAVSHAQLGHFMQLGRHFRDPDMRALEADCAAAASARARWTTPLLQCGVDPWAAWLWHEAALVRTFFICMHHEKHPQLQAVWTRFLDCSLGRLAYVTQAFQEVDGRDAGSLLPDTFKAPLDGASHLEALRAAIRAASDMERRPDSALLWVAVAA